VAGFRKKKNLRKEKRKEKKQAGIDIVTDVLKAIIARLIL